MTTASEYRDNARACIRRALWMRLPRWRRRWAPKPYLNNDSWPGLTAEDLMGIARYWRMRMKEVSRAR